MTRQQFESLRRDIEAERFECHTLDPHSYGFQRTSFERKKLQRLISLASKARWSTTAKTKLQCWRRQLERVEQQQNRFGALQKQLQIGLDISSLRKA